MGHLLKIFQQKIISYLSSPVIFQTNAAAIAPAIGAAKNNHNWDNAFPWANIAGPKLRAGFTEVPVIGIATR